MSIPFLNMEIVKLHPGSEILISTLDRVKILSELSMTVLKEQSPDQCLSHITQKTLASLDARRAILGTIEREGSLDFLGAFGFPKNIVEPYLSIPLWTPMPIIDAAQNGEIIVFRDAKEMIRAYPHLADFAETEAGVTVSSPISFRNTVMGVLGFTPVKELQTDFVASNFTKGVLSLCVIYLRNLLRNREKNSENSN